MNNLLKNLGQHAMITIPLILITCYVVHNYAPDNFKEAIGLDD